MANATSIQGAMYRQSGQSYIAWRDLSSSSVTLIVSNVWDGVCVSWLKFTTSSPCTSIKVSFAQGTTHYNASGGKLAYKVLSSFDSSYNSKVGSSNEDGSVSVPEYNYREISFTISKNLSAGTYYIALWSIPPVSDAFSTSVYYTSSSSVSVPVSITYTPAVENKLSTSTTSGVTLTASISASPFGRTGTSLTNNSKIYTGETITVSYSISSGYMVQTHTLNGSSFNSGATHVVSGNVNVVVSATYAISSISTGNGTFGTAQTITVTRYNSSYKHTIVAYCAGRTQTIATGSSSLSISWTPDVSIMNYITSSMSSSCRIECTTLNGTTPLGTSSITVTLSLPTSGTYSVKPTPSFTSVTDPNGYASTFGGYVQSKSRIAVTVSDGLKYSASVASRSSTANGTTYNNSSFTTSVINSTSATSISTTVKDSRGQTGTASTSITILAYTAPSITTFGVHRCNSSGVPDENGSYFYASYGFTISPLNNGNTKSAVVQYRKVGDSGSWADVPITVSSYTQTGNTSPTLIDTDYSYDVRLVITDYFGSVQTTTQLSTVAATLDFYSTGDGAAFGKVAESADVLDVAWNTHVRQDLTVDGGGNVTKAETGISANIDTEYDSTLFHTAQGTTGGTFPSVSSRHGAGITLPYRNAHGNAKPDYAGQIWIPNGDMANGANEMFFRASVANSWNAWNRVAKASMFDFKDINSLPSTSAESTFVRIRSPITIGNVTIPTYTTGILISADSAADAVFIGVGTDGVYAAFRNGTSWGYARKLT